MQSTPATQRVLAGTPSSLTCQWVDQNGEPIEAASNPAVIVRDAAGTQIATGTATPVDAGSYTFALASQQRTDRLTVTWTVAGDVRTTTVDVVGGVYFTVAQARASDKSLENATKYPTASLIAVRSVVEAAIEQAAGVAFVPRFSILEVAGNGSNQVVLPAPLLREVRTAVETTVTGQLRTLTVTSFAETGLVTFASNVAASSRVRCGVEHGHDMPPGEIVAAAITVLVAKASQGLSVVPSRAERIQPAEGGMTFLLAMPGKRKFGMPEVDAAIARHAWDLVGIS